MAKKMEEMEILLKQQEKWINFHVRVNTNCEECCGTGKVRVVGEVKLCPCAEYIPPEEW